MSGYGYNIPVRDRWAIVAYVRTLQAAKGILPRSGLAATLVRIPTEMAHHHVTSADIAINGDHLDNSKVAKVKTHRHGAWPPSAPLVSLYLLFFGPGEDPRALTPTRGCSRSYFFLTLSIGGCFWTLLHNVSNSGWGTSVRRTFENLGSTYPWMFLFGLPLLCPQVQQYLYEWMNTHRGAPPGDVKEHLHHTRPPALQQVLVS